MLPEVLQAAFTHSRIQGKAICMAIKACLQAPMLACTHLVLLSEDFACRMSPARLSARLWDGGGGCMEVSLMLPVGVRLRLERGVAPSA